MAHRTTRDCVGLYYDARGTSYTVRVPEGTRVTPITEGRATGGAWVNDTSELALEGVELWAARANGVRVDAGNWE